MSAESLKITLDALTRRVLAREKYAEREIKKRCVMIRNRMIRMDNAGKFVDVDEYVTNPATFGLNHIGTWFRGCNEKTAACDVIAVLSEHGVISKAVAEGVTAEYEE